MLKIGVKTVYHYVSNCTVHCVMLDVMWQVLADRLSMYMHAYTLYSFVRPFGCSLLLASYDNTDGAELYSIEPSGVCSVC